MQTMMIIVVLCMPIMLFAKPIISTCWKHPEEKDEDDNFKAADNLEFDLH